MTFQVWMFWLAGAALGGAGAFLICWGLFSDRLSGSWKKRRCRKCLYDMTSVAGLKCPECGREWRSEAQMRKVRRRWGMASLGVVLTLGAFGLNWYAVGLFLGWQNVAPVAILIRLSPIIGREQALRAVVPQGVSGLPSVNLVTNATNWTFAPTERIALDVLEDENSKDLEIFAAVDALHWMREHISREDDVVRALQSVVKNRSIPLYTWSDLYYTLVMKSASRQDASVVVTAVKSSGTSTQGFAGDLIQGGLTPGTAPMIPDLIAAEQVNGVTWKEFEFVSPELKGKILKRCREVYFAGDDEVKKRLSRFLWPNGSYMPAGNPDFEAMAREQIERFNCGEKTEALNMNSFVLWQASEPLSGLIPEIASMLSSQSDEGRTRAVGIFMRMELPHPRSTLATEALCSVLRDGNDAGRAAVIDIVNRRTEIDRHAILGELLGSIGSVNDPDVFSKLYRFVKGVQDVDRPGAISVSTRDAALEAVLRKHLDADGPVAPVSADWISKLPSPRAETIALLEDAARNPTKSRATRTAARDALLHIRDRTKPESDVLEPIR